MSNDQDFSNQPQSIGEIKASKSHDGGLWTPRDALINLLRQIDNGEIQVDMLIIGYAKVIEQDGIKYGQTDYINCTPSALISWGLWARVNYLLHDNKSVM